MAWNTRLHSASPASRFTSTQGFNRGTQELVTILTLILWERQTFTNLFGKAASARQALFRKEEQHGSR
jgi:hypothetical protein